ncbi:MAG: MFS transporter [Christensenellaceae bacterium]
MQNETEQGISKKTYRITLVIIFTTLLLFGILENIKSVAFPLIKSEFGTNYDEQGGLAAFSWFGYVIFCFIATLAIQKFGIKKSIMTGYALIICGICATFFAPNFIMVTIALWIINTGFGFFEVGANSLASMTFTKKTALMLSLMHFFYGVGAIIAPILSGIAINSFDVSWRVIYAVMVIPVVFMLIFIFKTKMNKNVEKPQEAQHEVKLNFVSVVKLPLVILFCLLLGLMEVIEFSVANWGNFYLSDALHLDVATTGALFVSVFYILFTLSRLVMAPAIEKIGYYRTMFLAVGSTIVLYIVGLLLKTSGIWALCATGFFIGIMWPTLMCIVFKIYKERSPMVSSVIITISGAINGVMQLATGWVMQRAGSLIGFSMSIVYCCITIILLLLIIKQSKTQKVKSRLSAIAK